MKNEASVVVNNVEKTNCEIFGYFFFVFLFKEWSLVHIVFFYSFGSLLGLCPVLVRHKRQRKENVIKLPQQIFFKDIIILAVF